MRLIDADELLEKAGRDKLDTRELIIQMIDNAPTCSTKQFEEEGIKKGYELARKDFGLIEKNLRDSLENSEKLNNQICGRLDMQNGIIKMIIQELIFALRNGR